VSANSCYAESRNYYPRFAAFWRVKPKHDFSLENGTWGAWEIGLRYSVLDLDDETSNLPSGGVREGAAEKLHVGTELVSQSICTRTIELRTYRRRKFD